MSKVRKENQSEKQSFIKFIIILAISFIGGGIAGGIGNFLGDTVFSGDETEIVHCLMLYVVPALFVGITVVVNAFCLIMYSKIKKEANRWNGEDEDVIDRVENRLNWVIVPTNILMGVNFFFFSATVGVNVKLDGKLPGIIFIIGMVTFVVGLFFNILISKLVVDLEKKLNPEKRGSVFDLNFAKEWENSCDEAQKQIIYKAAYQAYQVVNIVCTVMWLVAMFGQMIFGTGLFPVFCVCVIWITLIAAYSISAARMEAGK